MRFVTVRDLRGRSAEVWERLRKDKDMVITSNGKPIAILSAVSGDKIVEALAAIRRARAAAAVAAMQMKSVEVGADKMTSAEINAEIAAARRERAR
ncbi:MAG: type II toxin-antitoxin system prevent-host-death family antitoxin [Deltaproteobacteria bacterium]|nr:type II toxin-antitoxin system prevent-host-death family antitoxin [Deltaproteobacteria bacterium]